MKRWVHEHATEIALLLATVALLLAACGCTTPGGQAFGKCEIGGLSQTLQAVIAQVVAIAAQPAGWSQDLEHLGEQVGPAQLNCVVQAIANSMQPSGLTASQESPTRAVIRERLHSWLAQHKPTACRTRAWE